MQEIRTLFDLDAVQRASGQADPGKLEWLNQHYIKERPRDRLAHEVAPLLAAAGTPVDADDASFGALLDLLRERSKTLVEMAERARFFATPDAALVHDPDAVKKHWKPAARPALEDLAAALARVARWDTAGVEAAFHAVLARHEGLALGKLAQPVRIAVTGSAASPGIFETLVVLGRERTCARIARALAVLPAA